MVFQLYLIISAILIAALIYKIIYDKKAYRDIEKLNENLSQLRDLVLSENSRTKTEISTILSSSISSSMQNITSTITQLTDINLKKLSDINETLARELKYLQDKNEKKLEEMRLTVDEKLQATLEKRLTESFKTVSLQLENVYKGIGEMNRLAEDVGDLKKVLTNVKQRGIFGELQLKNILEDIFTPDQYIENARIKKNNFVEFAIKIPSKNEEERYLLLPVDSKFPREDYERIIDAQGKADSQILEKAVEALKSRIENEAREISEKYIDPPNTTDFAIMFIPVESLFAEILRIPELFEKIRKERNVIITGPTTLTAILNSLQMGFRTLAIEKKSSEVWKILAAVKTEFIKFGQYLSKTKQKLESAANEIEEVEKRTRVIEKRLKGVEQISREESDRILGFEDEIPNE